MNFRASFAPPHMVADARTKDEGGLGCFSVHLISLDALILIKAFGRYEDITKCQNFKFSNTLMSPSRKRIDSWVTSQDPALTAFRLTLGCCSSMYHDIIFADL